MGVHLTKNGEELLPYNIFHLTFLRSGNIIKEGGSKLEALLIVSNEAEMMGFFCKCIQRLY